MTRHSVFSLAIAFLLSSPASAYVRLKGSNGTPFYRPDYAQLQILLNSQALPGIVNGNGQTWVTADSDIAGALRNAANSWNAVPGTAAQFLPVQPTNISVPTPFTTVVAFVDSPAVRSAFLPGMLASTANTYTIGGMTDGAITSAIVYLNPDTQFSTTGVANTYDLQAVLTHELGHVLGANHTGGIGSAMFQNTNVSSTNWRNLSPDDVAFAANVYPAAPAAPYGAIAGTLSLGGSPLRSALVNAVDTTSGVVFSGLTSSSDGTYSVPAPAGNYYLFAQPITGPIDYNFYLYTTDAMDTGFQTSCLGGATAPTVVNVSPGAVTNGDFSSISGPPGIVLQYINTGGAGGFQDQTMLLSIAGSLSVPSGGQADIIMVGPGIDGTLTDSNVTLIGPLTLKPGSVRADGFTLSNGLQLIRFTVTVPAVTQPTLATLIINKSGSIATFLAGFVLAPPPPAPPTM